MFIGHNPLLEDGQVMVEQVELFDDEGKKDTEIEDTPKNEYISSVTLTSFCS